MRQRDWALVFGIGCVAVGVGLSLRGYPGADWDALILLLGALMLFRSAVEGPSPSRVAGLERAGRVILFIFAFAAVTRAQTAVAGAVSGALGNPVLWAVAALLVALPFLRRGLPWGDARHLAWAVVAVAVAGFALWALFSWLDAGDPALRTVVTLAAVANGWPVWRAAGPGMAGLVAAVTLCCVAVPPGAPVWPATLAAMPVGVAVWWLRRRQRAS